MEILIRELIKNGEKRLKEVGISDWKQDSFLLAEHVFGITRAHFLANTEIHTDSERAQYYQKLIEKRSLKIPLQHLIGVQEFMGFTFQVNESVLIPRQDTEVLVENVLEKLSCFYDSVRVLDVCTGTGCIAITIDKLCERAEVYASDISKEALKTAALNNDLNGTDVKLIESDLFDNISGLFDIIVSNPPYIKTSQIPKLMDEVKNHEPGIALDGGEDGLKFYRKITKNARHFLKKSGMVFYEIGNTQATDVMDILNENKFDDIILKKDLSGYDRVVIATWKGF